MAFFIIFLIIIKTIKSLDEDNENICYESCKTCLGSKIDEEHMNCETCFNNYYITEDTNSCYNFIPNKYYLDNTILRRCHPNCSICSSGSKDDLNMNCLSCIDHYALQYDTNNCIYSKLEQSELEDNLERKTTWFFVVFLILIIVDFLVACLICICPKRIENQVL